MTTTQADDKRKALIDKLGQQVEALRTSEGWQKWLAAAARFHDYSFNNQLLIAAQCPHATHVAGFNTWKSFGRCVRKGEKGIAILAPVVRKVTAENDDQTDGQPTEKRRLTGFRIAYVFDISQTDGEALNAPTMPVLEEPGREELHRQLCEVVRSRSLELVLSAEANGQARGWFSHDSQRITIVDIFPAASQCRTLIHELAHSLDPRCSGQRQATRAEIELVAESVAYIVGTRLGLALDDSSTTYAASWGADTAKLQSLAAEVIGLAGQLETHIESVMQPT